jgi:hypothetical protein
VPEPGWYADPSGGPGVRWWDGNAWTAHTQPSAYVPSPQAPHAAQQMTPVTPGQAHGPSTMGSGVVNAKAGKHQVYTDAQVISYGGKTLRLAAVDWVCYFVQRPKAVYHGALIGRRKSSLGTYFYFQIGHHPYFKGEFIEVHIPKWRNAESNPIWEALVGHARQYVEPRLVSEITAHVRAGRTVTLGPLTLTPTGIQSSGGAFGWRELSGAAFGDGEIQLFKGSAAVLKVSQANWNVSLLPALIPAIKASLGQ